MPPRRHRANASSHNAFFVASPDDGRCSSSSSPPAVPNLLHRVWIGGCPAVSELVSMLAATLLLAPDQIVYHVLSTLPSECLVQRAALPPLNVSACWAGLGVRFHRINVSDASAPFVRDALGASMARTLHDAGRSFSRVILADFARVYALLEHGGYYTDSDVFVTSANLTRWRRCPFVMSGNTGDAYDVAAGERGLRAVEARDGVVGAGTSGLLNCGALVAAPRTPFGVAWLHEMRSPLRSGKPRYSGHGWGDVGMALNLCSHWPHTYAEHHPGSLLGTPALRIAPWTLPRCHAWSNTSAGLAAIRKLPQQHRACAATAAEWRAQLDRIAARDGTHALHFANRGSRSRAQQQTTLHWALDHAVAQVGGDGALDPGQRGCVGLAREWLGVSSSV